MTCAEAVDRVRLIFRLLDVDGNGRLEAVDFDLMARRVVEAAPRSDDAAKDALTAAFRRYWDTLVTELDSDGDGKVDFGEYTACVLAPERFDDTVADFADSLAALGDPDGDGLIERPLFMALMIAIGFEPANIDALFDALEPTDDDRVSVESWAVAIREYYHPDLVGIPGDRLVNSKA